MTFLKIQPILLTYIPKYKIYAYLYQYPNNSTAQALLLLMSSSTQFIAVLLKYLTVILNPTPYLYKILKPPWHGIQECNKQRDWMKQDSYMPKIIIITLSYVLIPIMF